MAASPDKPAAVRAALLLVAVLVLAGSCGVAKGLGELGEAAPAAPARPTDSEPPNPDEATEDAARGMAAVLLLSPHRRALAGANVVVSLLLLVAASTLFTRRASAAWWATQACLANALWTVADTASQMAQLVRSKATLVALFERQIEAFVAQQGGSQGELPIEGDHYLWLWLATFAGLATLRLAFYAWVAFRVRRPDVRGLLGGPVGGR